MPDHFQLPRSPEAACLHQIALQPGISRIDLQGTLQLSASTTSRAIQSLAERKLVTHTSTNSSGPTRGRPPQGLRVDASHLLVAGAHIGLRHTYLALYDGAGRVLKDRTLDINAADHSPEEFLEHIGRVLEHLYRALPDSPPLHSAGFSFSAHVDAHSHVDSAAFGWDYVDARALLTPGLQWAGTLDPEHIFISHGVEAMAGYQLMATPLPAHSSASSTLYFYARELLNHTWIFNGRVHRPFTGRQPSFFTAIFGSSSFPADATPHPLSISTTLRVAQSRGLQCSSIQQLDQLSVTDPIARELLEERAELLAQLISMTADVVDPQSVVLAGEGFTGVPRLLPSIAAGVKGRDLRLQPGHIQSTHSAARATALAAIRDDPMSLPISLEKM